MKTRHKITLLFTSLVAAILLVVSISVYYFAALERRELFRKRLFGRANNNRQIFPYTTDTSRGILDRINTVSMELLPRKSVEIYTLTGKLLYQYASAGEEIGITQKIIQEAVINGNYFYPQNHREVLAVHYADVAPDLIILVSAYDDDGFKQLHQLKQIFIISLLFGAGIALFTGVIFSRQLVKPIAAVIKEVNEISSQSLSMRIHAGDNKDELSRLAETFNRLLDRLQESFNSQRRFISNASHELSTPLTSISSQLQVTLHRDRTPEEYRQVMASVQEDVMQMRQLTKSLLEIAHSGSQGNIELDEVRIDEVLFKVMADIKKANSAHSVELNFPDASDNDEDFLVFGSSDLLYIAVKNVVENGCKYSADHVAQVGLSASDGSTIIEITSCGEPISAEEQDRIFQPFYRSANASGTSGFGLGLALARNIMSLHKGKIDLRKEVRDRTVFVITLPTLKKGQKKSP